MAVETRCFPEIKAKDPEPWTWGSSLLFGIDEVGARAAGGNHPLPKEQVTTPAAMYGSELIDPKCYAQTEIALSNCGVRAELSDPRAQRTHRQL